MSDLIHFLNGKFVTEDQLLISPRDLGFTRGYAVEAGGSNVFAVIDNKLITTQSNIVEGLIRNTLLEVLHLNVPIEIRDFIYDELFKATEVFVTSSRNGSIGVVEIDGKLVGDGKVGAITKEVAKQYKDYIEKLV